MSLYTYPSNVAYKEENCDLKVFDVKKYLGTLNVGLARWMVTGLHKH